jgi:antitoxin CcdA
MTTTKCVEAVVAEAVKVERNRVWREENAAAIAAYAMEVARDGLLLMKYRSF